MFLFSSSSRFVVDEALEFVLVTENIFMFPIGFLKFPKADVFLLIGILFSFSVVGLI